MNHKIKLLSPAIGFAAKVDGESLPVAAWALCEDEKIRGLVINPKSKDQIVFADSLSSTAYYEPAK
jgi:hypothetical protein